MENDIKHSAYLLDDVDLFSTTTTTAANSNYSSTNFSNRQGRNSLIDAPVPQLINEKLIDFRESPSPPRAPKSISNSNSNFFVEQWPEVPSLNLEHRLSSSGSISSSQKDQNLFLMQNGPGPNIAVPNSNPISISNGFFNFHSAKDPNSAEHGFGGGGGGGGQRPISKSVNAIGLALPPKIEQRKSVLGSAPCSVLTNGFGSSSNESHVRYHRLSSSTAGTNLDNYDDLESNFSISSSTTTNKDGKIGKKEKDVEIDDSDDDDDDEVFLHIGSAGERASVLAPLTGGNRKKKVRFFEDGHTESELLVGSLPPTSTQNSASAVSTRKGRSWRPRLVSLTLILAVLLALAATVVAIIYVPWRGRRSTIAAKSQSILSSTLRRSNGVCSSLKIDYVGNVSVDNVYPTSALTSMCVKGRGDCKDTIVFGFGSTVAVPCYGSSECRGGVAAIDVATGEFAWRRPTLGEINGVNCRDDLNADGITDCLASGKRGVLMALDGKTGEPLWEAGNGQAEAEFFMPQMVQDMDNDGVPEVLATMVVRVEDYMRLYFLSGKTGKAYLKHASYVLNLRGMDTTVPSMIWKHGESLPDVILSAGSFARRGGVYDYALQSFLLMRLEKGRLVYNSSVVTPPVFADVNGDSFGDMVFCTIGGELAAVDGASGGNLLWKFKAPQGECASPLVIGFYNADSIPDIAATYCFGDGFPTYRYCETVFVDGRNGRELKGSDNGRLRSLLPTVASGFPIAGGVSQEWTGSGNGRVRSLLPTVASGLSIRTNSKQGDVFLIWKTTCGGTEESVNYRFMDAAPGDRAGFGWSYDICRQLYGRRASYQLLAVGAGMVSPTVVFDSSMRNFDEELEKFASVLGQLDSSFGYSYVNKRKVASLQLGPAGTFVVGRNDSMVFVDLVLPTFVSVASSVSVVSTECLGINDDSRLCGNQLERIVQQSNNRMASVDFSGGLLIHKLRLRCDCVSNLVSKDASKCADFLSENRLQPWSEFLGSNSDGRFLV